MHESETIIKPKSPWFSLNLRELLQYWDLIILFVKRNFTSLYKQTILGPAWAIIQPLLTTMVFTLIFGNIANLGAAGVPNFVFFLCANVAWHYFATCLTETANTFTANAAILGKVYFPRLVMPISTVLTNLISFAIQFAMFAIALVIYVVLGENVHPNLFMLLLPALVLQMALLALGCGIIISACTTKYRDLRFVVGFGVQLWMYGTPVAYDIGIIPERFMGAYMLNPMTPIINAFRYAFLGTGRIDWGFYAIGWGVTLALLFLGIVLFSRVEKTFMDTI
ncbi:MAG: ABC transporter permease [Clostridiales bacterium]|nr:ABC transporter permease [Clostridiales bacterium]